MATGQYIGVNGVARKVASPYIGVEGVARNVKNGYVGVDGVARLFFAPESGGPVILEVEKITADTSTDNETVYSGDEFIILNIYPKSGGTVKVTYGGLTKTITDTSGTEEPNAQSVYFGTLYGVSDSIATPTSGTLTISGDYRGFAVGTYTTKSSYKTATNYCSCITAVTDISGIEILPINAFRNCSFIAAVQIPDSITTIKANAFDGCTNLALTSLPSGLTSIDDYAFDGCTNLALTSLPSGLTSIGNYAFYFNDEKFSYTGAGIAMLRGEITIPSSVTSIGQNAFCFDSGDSYARQYLATVRMMATTPPTASYNIFGSPAYDAALENAGITFKVIVPKGCAAAYKAAENWSTYADYIVEAT